MCLSPCTEASEFSILRATSVSICAGEAPGSEAVTVTIGRSMSGKFWIFIAWKPSRPARVSMMKSRMDGVGLRIDQDETLIMVLRLLPSLLGGDRLHGVGRCRRGGGGFHHPHRVAVGQETAARG